MVISGVPVSHLPEQALTFNNLITIISINMALNASYDPEDCLLKIVISDDPFHIAEKNVKIFFKMEYSR